MANKQVSSEVLQELTNKIQEIVNNYCWNLEYFTDSEVEGFFQASADEVTFYNGLINDKIESQNFLWSSKHVAEKIAQSIIEANGYTDNMIKNIASIQLEWCETNLPTTAENNKIYILPVASGGKTVNTLNIWNNTSNDWVSIGNLEIDITQFYDKNTIDTKMDLKANKTEVVANDKIMQTLDSTTNSSDTVLSTSGLQTEMDKKANDDEVIKKTDITTTIDSTSTDSELPTAKTIYEKTKNMCTTTVTDVPLTNIAPSDTTTFINFKGNSSCNYCVKNGVCFVLLWGVQITSTGGSKRTGVFLPKSANNRAGVILTGDGDAIPHAFAYVGDTGELRFDVKDTNVELYGSFSYPVAEN